MINVLLQIIKKDWLTLIYRKFFGDLGLKRWN